MCARARAKKPEMNDKQRRAFYEDFTKKWSDRLVFEENQRHLDSFEAFELFCAQGSNALLRHTDNTVVDFVTAEARWLNDLLGHELLDAEMREQPPITFFKVIYKRKN